MAKKRKRRLGDLDNARDAKNTVLSLQDKVASMCWSDSKGEYYSPEKGEACRKAVLHVLNPIDRMAVRIEKIFKGM